MSKVSVILTCYNHGKYIREAIESVLVQTFADFELIIWDDASSDNSWEIIQSYKDSRIKAFRNDKNRLAIYGINKTIAEVASGEYIAIHHSDDIWEPAKLEHQVEFLEKNPGIGAVFTNALAIGEDGQPFKDTSHYYYSIFDQPNRTRHEWLNFFFYHGNALCHPSLLIRKKCYQDCGLYRFGPVQLTDFDMWIRLCLKYEIHVFPKKLVRFRVRENEANASGNRLETQVRTPIEFYDIFKNYLLISTYDEMVRVFPNAGIYNRAGGFQSRFVLAMMAFDDRANRCAKLFGIGLLFDLLANEKAANDLRVLYNFDYFDFMHVTAKYDVFSTVELTILRQVIAERDGQIKALNKDINNIQNDIKNIQSIFAYRVYRKLKKIIQGIINILKPLRVRLKNCFNGVLDKIFPLVSFMKYFSWKNFCRFIHLSKQEGFKFAVTYIICSLKKRINSNCAFLNHQFCSVDPSLTDHFSSFSLPSFPHSPDVSVIIPVYNQWKYTYNCLSVLSKACSKHSFEVILADDGSTDGTMDAAKIVKNIKIIRDGEKRGFLLNCNNAAKFASGKYLYFLNNDTKCADGAIDRLVEVLEQDPKAGIVGSKLIYPDFRLQEAGGIVWADGSAWNYGRLEDPALPEFCYRRETDYVSGASLMVRKELWQHLEGFDSRYSPAYCEDSDLCFAARRAGYRVIFQPESLVIHYEGVSNGKDISSGVKQYQVQNSRAFADKWRDVLTKEHFPNSTDLFVARDRTAKKKTILVIDHYVPHYDKDAGSRTIWAFICAMLDAGFNVKFIGDNFYPHQPYTDELQRRGVEVLYGPWYMRHWKDWLKENGRFFDLVLFNRPHVTKNFVKVLREYTQARFVYYCHDLHFLREERRLQLPGEKPGSLSVEEIRNEELNVMGQMDAIMHCSKEEIAIIQRELPGKDVRYVSPYAFNFPEILDFDPAERQGFLFVGGFAHPPNVDSVIWFANEVFPGIQARYPDAILHIVGSNPTPAVEALAAPGIEIHKNVSDLALKGLYNSVRLAVVPLRYGAGVKLKTVEAMAYGLPVVTTSYGVEGLPEEMKAIAMVCADKNDMINTILAAYENYPGLSQRSSSGSLAVKRWFSSSAMSSYWKDFILERG